MTRKRDVIVSAVQACARRTTHKYGIKLPAPGKDIVRNALELYHKKGNTLYVDALSKEMCSLNIAFEYLEHGDEAPPGWFWA